MERNLRRRCPGEHFRDKISEEKGAALAIALMLMVVLAFIGSAAIITSTTEVQIAGNEKRYQMAFYGADGGADFAPRVIRDTIDLYAAPSYGSGVTVMAGFLDEALAFGTANDDGSVDSPTSNPDIEIPSVTAIMSVGIDVDRDPNTTALPGGGIEFGSGYEGIGGGAAAGGTAILYRIASQSQGPGNSRTQINTRYLYVTGVGGS